MGLRFIRIESQSLARSGSRAIARSRYERASTWARRGTQTPSTGADLQSWDLPQRVNNLFGQTVAEILLLLIGAHVRERQDRDRGLVACRLAYEGLQRGFDGRHALESLRGVLAKATCHDSLQSRGRFERLGVIPQHCRQALESAPPRDELVQCRAKCEDVRFARRAACLPLAPETCTKGFPAGRPRPSGWHPLRRPSSTWRYRNPAALPSL